MKKLLLFIILMLPLIHGFEITANSANLFENSDEYLLDFEGKILAVDKLSLAEIDVKITDDGVFVQDIQIKQLSEEKTYIYFGKPTEELLKSNLSLVYIVEHYYPDLGMNDPKRTEGWRRLTAVIKDAEVEVKNGIIIRTDGLKIFKNSFFENTDDREIDFIKEKRLFELFPQATDMIIRSFRSFRLNQKLDRGYTGIGEERDLDTIEFSEYYDIVEGEKIE